MNFDSPNVPRIAKTGLVILSLAVVAVVVWQLLPSDEPAYPEVTEHPGQNNSSQVTEIETDEEESSVREIREKQINRVTEKIPRSDIDSETDSVVVAVITDDLQLESAFLETVELIATPSSTNYAERSAAVRALGEDLGEDEIKALYRFLMSAPPSGDRALVYNRAIKSDVLSLLRKQASPPGELTDTMIAMFEDSSQDEAVRDYAVQHLGLWHDEVPIEQREVILETLVDGLEEHERSIAGTSLLGLFKIYERGASDVTRESLREWSLELATNPEAGVLSQVSALQIAGNLEVREVLPHVIQLARDSENPYPLRLTAIALIGHSGDAEALRVLAEIEKERDPHLESAIRRARKYLGNADAVDG